MEQENRIQVDLEKQIEEIFNYMTSNKRKTAVEQQKSVEKFITTFTENQEKFAEHFVVEGSKLPESDKKIPKTAADANTQLSPFIDFMTAKESEIDSITNNLVKDNDEMSSKISKFLNK